MVQKPLKICRKTKEMIQNSEIFLKLIEIPLFQRGTLALTPLIEREFFIINLPWGL